MSGHARFAPYRAKDGWRWRLLAANGLVVAESGEAYATRAGCRRAIARVRELVDQAPVEVAFA